MGSEIYKRNENTLKLSPGSSLVYIWISGLLVGFVLAFLCRGKIIGLVPIIYPAFLSAPGKFLLSLIPFLLSAYAVIFSHPKWMFWICGIKAICFAVCSFLLCLCYGQAGWLARWLIMFFDTCSIPLLFCYWLWSFTENKSKNVYMHVIFALTIAAILIIDYRIVTPYAAKFGFI